MQAVIRTGLSGKARRARVRSRAARLHAQQLVSEYLEPDPEALYPERYIPVRSQSEFAPSVLQHHDELVAPLVAEEAGAPLELSLATDDRISSPSLTGGVQRKANMAEQAGRGDRAIRFPGMENSPVRGYEIQNNGRREELTFRGFAVGCAMGSAAAAMVLLVLRTAIG